MEEAPGMSSKDPPVDNLENSFFGNTCSRSYDSCLEF